MIGWRRWGVEQVWALWSFRRSCKIVTQTQLSVLFAGSNWSTSFSWHLDNVRRIKHFFGSPEFKLLFKCIQSWIWAALTTFILCPTLSGRGGVGGGDFSFFLFIILFGLLLSADGSDSRLTFARSCFHLRSSCFNTAGGSVNVSFPLLMMLQAAISFSITLSMYFLEYLPWWRDWR